MYIPHNRSIILLPPERHYHPATNLYISRHLFRKRIRKAAMQGKGQYDINELFHYSGKDSTFQKEEGKRIKK